jgi:hypothetical protein
MNVIGTTMLRMVLIVPCIGMKELISQRATPTTIKVRTTPRRGMAEGNRKCRVVVWGLTLFGRVAEVSG